jgi:hypothetical protein
LLRDAAASLAISRKFANVRRCAPHNLQGLQGFRLGLGFAISSSEWRATLTIKIERVSENGEIRFSLSGELRSEEVGQINAEIAKVLPKIALDCAELWVVDIDGLRWLKACEAVGIKVEKCAPYIREWMLQEKI